jgi:hypothetical protein
MSLAGMGLSCPDPPRVENLADRAAELGGELRLSPAEPSRHGK